MKPTLDTIAKGDEYVMNDLLQLAVHNNGSIGFGQPYCFIQVKDSIWTLQYQPDNKKYMLMDEYVLWGDEK